MPWTDKQNPDDGDWFYLIIAVIVIMLIYAVSASAEDETPRVKVDLNKAVHGCTFKILGDRKLYSLVYVTGKKPAVDEDGKAVMEWWVIPKEENERSHDREGRTISDNVPEDSVLFYSTKWGRVLGERGCKCPPWNGQSPVVSAEQ